MRTKRLNTENGFTLVEVLIAMLVLSVGIFSLYAMQTTSMRGNTKANQITTAATWNMDQVEKVVGLDYSTIGASGSNDTSDGHYTVSWTVATDEPIEHVKTITVQVTDKGNVLSIPVTFTYIKPEKI